MSVSSAKVNLSDLVRGLSVESVSNTFSLELNFNIQTVVHDNVKCIRESLNFISLAAHIDSLLFLGLDNAVALDNLPNGVLVLGEGCVFGINLANIGDNEALTLIFEHLNLTPVELCFVKLDIRASRGS